MDAETLHPTWVEFADIVADLANRVAADGVPDVVVGIARGGLIPAVLIAHALGIRDVRGVAITHTTTDGRDAPKTVAPVVRHALSLGDLAAHDVLVVDDIAGSGDTLTTALALIDAARPARVRSAVCFLNETNWADNEARSVPVPDVVGGTSLGWVVLPWEQRGPEPASASGAATPVEPTQHHGGGARSTIAFCLLSYRPNHPSGIERSIAALATGCRQLGHDVVILAAGPAHPSDQAESDLIRLRSITLPRPAVNDDVRAALADDRWVRAEVSEILRTRGVDVVCWADTLWGLGYLSPAPDGVRTVLMAHKIRSDVEWFAALAGADVVCPASDYLHAEAEAAGYDTGGWRVVPNPLLTLTTPPPPHQRETLRRDGPIRIVSRVEPAKGIPELLAALPAAWTRPIELVLAAADFEFWPGMQREVLDACRAQAERCPNLIQVQPALGWKEVPPYLSGAAATIIASTEAETFCHVAAEALSVGTPVITFDHGNVPGLAGLSGRAVPLAAGAGALWRILAALLDDREAYHVASQAAPWRVAGHTPTVAAAALLNAVSNAWNGVALPASESAPRPAISGPP